MKTLQIRQGDVFLQPVDRLPEGAVEVPAERGRIVIETPALSEAAWAERGTDAGKLRHLACAHELIAELRHQATKHGATVELRVAAASAQVPRRVRNRQAVRTEGGAAVPLAAGA